MPLSSVALTLALQWQQYVTNAGGYQNTVQGPDSENFNLSGISVTQFNQLYTATFSIATTASQTVDLTSVTNLVGEAVTFAHALSILVVTSGGQITLSPGASNGLVWFFGGTSPTITIPAGGMFCFSDPANATGQVVDSTHKTLNLLNSGTPTTTVSLTVIGSTT